MTERKINFALKKISDCKKAGHNYEACIRLYQLNAGLIKYLLDFISPDEVIKGKKLRSVVKQLQSRLQTEPQLNAIIQKSSVKSLRSWLDKNEKFFKSLKNGEQNRFTGLIQESEKIYAILKISSNKLKTKTGLN